ncbi:response regulator transcription factor [Leifsonia shinshuensis]|uniref:response regulator transcription factor n=1 Tax=Leifsonia shinshuensis TaxID=150026 RepID=UPI0028608A2B|nr:response regulator transcription factor [Leifsonia shinshuensis]MDR6972365.1 DNA-binding response OmpR family regulator [Leifsonia shinshuensis]
MTDTARVLIAEDDSRLAGMLDTLLRSEGFDVEVARDGQRALHLGLTGAFAVIVLDRGLPAIEGLDVLRRLRENGVTTPILVLSALGTAPDRVDGLNAGAEDYLAKPFDIDELVARVRALNRRASSVVPTVRFPGGRLDTDSRTVTVDDGRRTVLSERESALLERLARRPRQVFSRAVLLDEVFADADDPGVVDTYVHHLRRKFGRTLIETVRGVGYRMGSL